MKYQNIYAVKFISRPNRFIAIVDLNGAEIIVHVKNTGRCKELLIPGITVYLMEVKGCTLFVDGVGDFPDAPTQRGAKHLRELTASIQKGIKAKVAFVIQGEGISEVRPNAATDPDFAKAFEEAEAAGVEIIFYLCRVTRDSIEIIDSQNINHFTE